MVRVQTCTWTRVPAWAVFDNVTEFFMTGLAFLIEVATHNRVVQGDAGGFMAKYSMHTNPEGDCQYCGNNYWWNITYVRNDSYAISASY